MAHIHDKIDYTVDVFVVFQKKVLLRMHDKYHIWLAVGGHVELDEDPNQAAVREVKEEVGLDVKLVGENKVFVNESLEYKELVPPRFMNIHSITPTHQHVSLVYFATSETDEVKPSGDDVSNVWRWLTIEDLGTNTIGLKASIQYYAAMALMEASL